MNRVIWSLALTIVAGLVIIMGLIVSGAVGAIMALVGLLCIVLALTDRSDEDGV